MSRPNLTAKEVIKALQQVHPDTPVNVGYRWPLEKGGYDEEEIRATKVEERMGGEVVIS